MITQSLASQIIIDILNNEMQMPKNAVWLREQNKTIPNDDNLYIIVGLVNADTIANETQVQVIGGNSYEVNMLAQREAIQIDVLSSATDNLAMLRNWEVIAALQSYYSQQAQEANYFKIFRIPRFLFDASSAEGGSMIQRYTITIVCHVWYRKQKLLGDYYNDFTVQADDENSIGTVNPIAKFEINSGTKPPLLKG